MEYGYGKWWLVGVSIILTLYFIKSVFKPRTKADWTTYRTFGAFIVALFTEMYGFPLTIYLLMSVFGVKANLGFSHDSGHLIGSLLNFQGNPHLSIFHLVSYLLIILGFSMIALAWKVLYKARKANSLAVSGLYKYIRHPQYVGFSLIIIGFLLQWPTIITVFMAPFLLWRYWRLSKLEENEMAVKFKGEYLEYKKYTPAFIPSLTNAFKEKKLSKLTFISKLVNS